VFKFFYNILSVSIGQVLQKQYFVKIEQLSIWKTPWVWQRKSFRKECTQRRSSLFRQHPVSSIQHLMLFRTLNLARWTNLASRTLSVKIITLQPDNYALM